MAARSVPQASLIDVAGGNKHLTLPDPVLPAVAGRSVVRYGSIVRSCDPRRIYEMEPRVGFWSLKVCQIPPPASGTQDSPPPKRKAVQRYVFRYVITTPVSLGPIGHLFCETSELKNINQILSINTVTGWGYQNAG